MREGQDEPEGVLREASSGKHVAHNTRHREGHRKAAPRVEAAVSQKARYVREYMPENHLTQSAFSRLQTFFAGGERKKMPQEVYVREYTPEKHLTVCV